QFLPPRRLTTEQLTHCSIYIYPCTSCTLHFFFALLLCNNSQLLYIAIPPCIYFLNFLDRCTVALFVLYCVVMYISCKHTESLPSHFTWNQIPCLCKLTWPIKLILILILIKKS